MCQVRATSARSAGRGRRATAWTSNPRAASGASVWRATNPLAPVTRTRRSAVIVSYPPSWSEPGAVRVGDERDRAGPLDAEGGIVEADTGRGLAHVARRALVEEVRVRLEGQVAVRAARRQVEHLAAVGGEDRRDPPAVRRRGRTHVDGHVLEPTTGAAHELGLAVRLGLVVHPTERAGLRVPPEVELDPLGLDARGGEFVRAPRAGEEAALVADGLELDAEDAVDGGRFELHRPIPL